MLTLKKARNTDPKNDTRLRSVTVQSHTVRGTPVVEFRQEAVQFVVDLGEMPLSLQIRLLHLARHRRDPETFAPAGT